MNFLVVVPRFVKYGKYYVFPQGLAYISASLKSGGFDVFNLNLCHHQEPVKDLLKEAISCDKINVVCTGGMSFHWNEIEEILNAIKEIDPNVITICGGAVVTCDPVFALENLKIDIGVIGEGEETVVAVADALSNKNDLAGVLGITYKKPEIVVNPPRPPIKDLDAVPLPDYEGLEFEKWLQIEWIFQPSVRGLYFDLDNPQRIAEINGSRGCLYRCTFCYHPLGKKYRQRSLDNIFKEIDYLKKTYDITIVNLQDELFSADEKRIIEFSERIKKFNIPWMAQWRVDNINKTILQKIKDSGVLNIGLGVESLSDTILTSMKKKITKAQIEKAHQLCDAVGVWAVSNIILGDVAETWETANE
jgi:anaerobic magnesium-protoporphyrin IX monomethyl ester cyclase